MKTKTTLGPVNNIFKCKAADRLEQEMDFDEISRKVKWKILSILERCKSQLSHLKKIEDLTFRGELIHERQRHFTKLVDDTKYWKKEIHARWVKSIIVALCRTEIKNQNKIYEN